MYVIYAYVNSHLINFLFLLTSFCFLFFSFFTVAMSCVMLSFFNYFNFFFKIKNSKMKEKKIILILLIYFTLHTFKYLSFIIPLKGISSSVGPDI